MTANYNTISTRCNLLVLCHSHLQARHLHDCSVSWQSGLKHGVHLMGQREGTMHCWGVAMQKIGGFCRTYHDGRPNDVVDVLNSLGHPLACPPVAA